MFKFIINAISRALGFSKTEAKGTLMLIFIIFSGLVTSQALVREMKSRSSSTVQNSEELQAWIKSVEASYELKKQKSVEFDKSVYLPKNDYNKKTSFVPKKRLKESEKRIRKETPLVILDLNKATPEQLQRVNGIGPSYSERIVKYRELLGGFADSTQLVEVYGLDEEIAAKVLSQFSIQSEVLKIPINSDSLKVLARHPYISYDMAKIILNYRKAHGDYVQPEELMKIKTIDEQVFLRLKPYLE
ncbi:MAG: ComEA family DNA-binding protein [Ekhidna sp.]